MTRLREVIGRALNGLTTKLRKPESSNGSGMDTELRGDEGTAPDKLIDGKNITVTGSSGEEVGYVMGWTSRKIPAEFRPILWSHAGRLELEAWRGILKDESRELPNDLTLIFWDGLPLAVWIPAGHLRDFNFNPN